MKTNTDTTTKNARGFGGLFARVRRTVASHAMFEPDAPIVLMVSGGSDSVALAALLTALYPQNPAVILHINHMLRGEAVDDEKFVAALARRLGLAFHAVQVDVAALAASAGDNIEQVGREERYRYANQLLDELCVTAGVDPAMGRIAVAHTLDDRVETFYMRTIVGGGAGSLGSIPYVNGRVVRPLLDCTRQELREWLSSPADPTARPWREDATNADTTHLRAFVRHELIPMAQTRNPELLATLRRSLDILSSEDAYLDALVDELEACYVTAGEGESLLVDGAVFSTAKPLLRRLLHRVCGKVLPKGERITFEHVETVTNEGQRVGFVTNLPSDVLVRNVYGTLVIQRNSQRREQLQKLEFDVPLQRAVPCNVPQGGVLELFEVPAAAFASDPVGYARRHATSRQVFVDGSALDVQADVRVANLREGERFCPLGMQGRHKLVSDVLIDRKVPLEQRAKQPVVRVNGRIVWIVGVQLDDRYKVTDKSNTMVGIRFVESEQVR